MGMVLWDQPSGSWKSFDGVLIPPPPPPDPDPEPGVYPVGWLLTTQNTGIAGVGTTEAMLTSLSVPQYGGAFPNLTGTHYRRRIDLGGNVLAPGSNTVLEECLITGDGDLVELFGDNIHFKNCTFEISGAWTTDENVHINGHPNFAGSGSRVLVEGCQLIGGTMFLNITSMGADILGCYGHSQQPETGGLQHRDGFTTRGASAGNPIRVAYCRFDTNQNSTTGAFFIQDTYGSGISGVTAEYNMFEGAGNCMTIEHGVNLIIRHNRTRPYGPYMGGDFTNSGKVGATYAEWSDNHRWIDSPPDYRGAVIN